MEYTVFRKITKLSSDKHQNLMKKINNITILVNVPLPPFHKNDEKDFKR